MVNDCIAYMYENVHKTKIEKKKITKVNINDTPECVSKDFYT